MYSLTPTSSELNSSGKNEKIIETEEILKECEENLHLKNKYVCEMCGKKFCFNSSLGKHINEYPEHFYCKGCEVRNYHKYQRVSLRNSVIKKNQIRCKSLSEIKYEDRCYADNDENNGITTENTVNDDDKNKSAEMKSPQVEGSKHKIYKCQECVQLFDKYLDLCQHSKKIHKKQGKLKCPTCDEDFNTNEEFKQHVAMHGPEDKIVCKGCKKTFTTLKLYYIHAKQNPGIHCFICKLCLRKFSTELLLDQHVCICQNGKPLHCACGKEFTRYNDVINHSKGTKPFLCCTCPHVANSLTAYIRHLRKHSKQKPYQCTKCDMKFAVIDFLNIHNKKFHNDSESEVLKEQNPDLREVKSFPSNLNNEEFISENELREPSDTLNEQKNETEGERVQCPDCGKLLKKNRLDIHRNTHKTSASLCPKCGKLFDTRFKLTQHIITAHNNEPVKCEVCEKVLKTKKILNEHMKTHLKSEFGRRIPQAICPMCGLGLAQKGSLARHILLTHEKHKIVPNNKTYTCQECSEILPNRAKYYSHRRMHRAMIDRFPCKVCGREFNKKQNLKRHMYLIHDETRVLADPIFKCQFCTRRFREKKNLKRHYKMVHKLDIL